MTEVVDTLQEAFQNTIKVLLKGRLFTLEILEQVTGRHVSARSDISQSGFYIALRESAIMQRFENCAAALDAATLPFSRFLFIAIFCFHHSKLTREGFLCWRALLVE